MRMPVGARPRLLAVCRARREGSGTRGVARVAISGGSHAEGDVSSCWPIREQPFAATIPWDKL